ncbi:MAG: hypothetical protein NC177_14605 [Ruminococcus flavefaciens]|nr:hypothetical protein [Ruminococcus flavefaciens]
MKKEAAEVMCIDLYLNTPDPIQLSVNTFYGLYYLLLNLDMLNYANTALMYMMLRDTPVNRVDLVSASSDSDNSASVVDNSTASGSTGREFNNGSKRTSILDR